MKKLHILWALFVPTICLIVIVERLVLRRPHRYRGALEIRSDEMSTGGIDEFEESYRQMTQENTQTVHNSGYALRKVADVKADWPGLAVPSFERSAVHKDPQSTNPSFDVLQGLKKLGDQLDRMKGSLELERPVLTLPDRRISKTSNLKTAKRTNVIISAGMRTGSTFVGQIFNSHPDFFFLFEPLFGLRSMENGPEISVHGVRTLYKLYHCDFYSHGMDEYFSWYNGLFQWQRDQRCYTLDRYEASGCCSRAKNIAVKTIRIMDIRDYVSLMQDPSIDLKVIVVVRDPRAMMASLMPVYQAGYNYDPVIASLPQGIENLDGVLLDRLKHYCDVNLRNYMLVKSASNILVPWRKNVMVVRFEDIALQPVKLAKQIYDFVGPKVNIHHDVLRWIHNNTKEDTEPDYTNGNYGFENKRNSTKVTDKWRHKLSFDLVETIQNTGVCLQYMRLLGYLPIYEPVELRDDSIQLFDKSRGFSYP